MEHVPGRSINLAMSIRGRTGLKMIGVEDHIIANHGIPMRGRMIHQKDGTTNVVPYNKDGKVSNCIISQQKFKQNTNNLSNKTSLIILKKILN